VPLEVVRAETQRMPPPRLFFFDHVALGSIQQSWRVGEQILSLTFSAASIENDKERGTLWFLQFPMAIDKLKDVHTCIRTCIPIGRREPMHDVENPCRNIKFEASLQGPRR
jgi:hypothetical protein